MIMVQVLLGGITRLTESGLSITEWKPITGALPPMNEMAWQQEFDKYRVTDQFKYVHQYFSIEDFKFIFFWEWFHRLWARMIGIVFLAGFFYFLLRRKLEKKMIVPLVFLFLLGGLQGAIGWLMVKSGLVPEKYFVGHIELTTHLIAALILLAYTWWFALKFSPSFQSKIDAAPIRNILITITVLFFLQLMYGGFMAGLRAAKTAPTWPSINGAYFPDAITEITPWTKNLLHNPITIQFIHRSIGYLLALLSLIFIYFAAKEKNNALFNKVKYLFILLMMLQVFLGIFTLLNATSNIRFIWLGVLHQFNAMLLLVCLVSLLFMVEKTKEKSTPFTIT